MVGGRPYCLSCLFTLSAVLLLTVSLPDVEASICSGIIHKKVGDTVEFSSCLPAEGVTFARWKQGDRLVADLDPNAATEFRDRFYLNPTNFSLTVRKLTLQDSGQFSFVSEVNKKQRETVSITLQVHEPITEQPDLQVNSTWEALHGSCTVLLQCSSTSDRNVNYILSVRNRTHSGSSLQFTLRPEDGETTITCTISDFISEMSTSKTVKCRNSTEPLNPIGPSSVFYVLLIVGLVVVAMTVLLFVLFYFTKAKDKCCDRLKAPEAQPVSQEESQQPVYSSLLHGDGSVYETIIGCEQAAKGPREKNKT